MTEWQAALAALVLFAAGMIKGIIGFALPLIGVPFLSIFLSPREAVIIMSIPVFLTNWANAQYDWRQWRHLREIVPFIAAGIAAVPVGVYVLRWADPELIRLLMGLAVYFYLASRRFLPPAEGLSRASRWGVGGALGVLAGFMTGVASVPGPVSIVYFSMFTWPKEVFIFLMNAFNTVVSGVLLSSLAQQGAFTWPLLQWAGLLLVPIFAGLWVGIRLRDRLDQKLFYRAVRIALFWVATSLVVRSGWKFLLSR